MMWTPPIDRGFAFVHDSIDGSHDVIVALTVGGGGEAKNVVAKYSDRPSVDIGGSVEMLDLGRGVQRTKNAVFVHGKLNDRNVYVRSAD